MESSIRDFYKNKSVFITGASGLVGQICMEKLLRCCEVKKIYLLIRNKKDQTWQQRIEKMCEDEFYNTLRKHNPDFKKQIIGIVGDCALPNLGISDADREELRQNVNIVFHCAATVNFEERLSTSIKINVRGTQGVIDLCKQMKDLQAFVHCSTAFSNCNRDVIEEKFYKTKISGSYALEMLEHFDEDTVDAICPELKGTFPNTYCFTKNLAEDLVQEKCNDLPAVVFRPAIIIATYKEPCAGWINNFYGPIGVLYGIARGVLRAFHADGDAKAVIVPVDMTVNAMLSTAWDIARNKYQSIPIYNFVTHKKNTMTYKNFLDIGWSATHRMPSIKATWFYVFQIIKNPYLFALAHFFYHILPAMFIDIILILANKKIRLLTVYKKIRKMNKVFEFFAFRGWEWDYDNVTALWQKMSPKDQEWLNFDMYSIDWNDYAFTALEGMRYYILKDTPDTIEAARKQQKKLKIAHYSITIPFKLFMLYLVYSILSFFYSQILNIFS